jgi:hypothetical protein
MPNRPPPAGRDAVVGELVGVPAEAHAELDPAPGQVIERGDGLGQRDRVVRGRQGHRRAQPDRGGDRAPSTGTSTIAGSKPASRLLI